MMKIERVEVFGVAVPLVGEYKNAYKSKSIQKSAIVRITATGGAVGLGNIDPSPGYSMETIEDSLEMLRTRLAGLPIFIACCISSSPPSKDFMTRRLRSKWRAST